MRPATPIERWRTNAERLTWQAGHLDAATFECFKVAVAEGIAREDAFDLAISRIRAAGSRLRTDKLERQWLGALKWVGNHGIVSNGNGVELGQTYQPRVEYGRLDSIVRAGPGIYDLWEQSPLRFEDHQSHTEEIIDALFSGDSWLCVGIGKHDFWTRRRETLRGHLARTEFIVAQPMNCQFGITLEGRLSEHSLANTGPRKYYVVEFDFREKDKTGKDTEWAELVRGWASLDISVADACAALLDHFSAFAPLGLVLHSAGKSCHGWFPSSGATPEQIEEFRHQAFVLGADRQLFRNKSQFVRTPDGIRSATGQRQSTYYFDPKVFFLCQPINELKAGARCRGTARLIQFTKKSISMRYLALLKMRGLYRSFHLMRYLKSSLIRFKRSCVITESAHFCL